MNTEDRVTIPGPTGIPHPATITHINPNNGLVTLLLDTGLTMTHIDPHRLTPEHLTPTPKHRRTTKTTRDTIIETINGWVPAHDRHINIHGLADDICEALHLDGQAPTP